MSTNLGAIGLRLSGSLQSWGFDSRYSRRATALLPTKSALVGMCCAAMGIPRGAKEEQEVLSSFQNVRLLVIAVPRFAHANRSLPVRRIQDYHTVADTITAERKVKKTHLTYRQYLCDAEFLAVFEGDAEFLSRVARALEDPTWGIWLGRKACVPTAPVLVQSLDDITVFSTRSEVCVAALGSDDISMYSYIEDTDNIEEGSDSIPDTPLSFSVEQREYQLRHIKKHDPISGSASAK